VYNAFMTDVEQIKERLDIAEVVGNYIQLKQAGRNLKAPCPFHHEKTASFMVSPEKQIYHCFGCGEGGDVIKFVMKMDGLEFREALEELARRAGVELQNKPVDTKAKHERERLGQAVALAVKYYQASLVKNQLALAYVKKRGMTKQTLKDFQVGYAPDDWNALSNFLVKKNFNAAELKRSGLVGQKSGRDSIYDLLRGRLIFTICDASGAPVGFTGRVLDAGEPKYLNTPATPLYDKSRVIFGLHLARTAIREADEVVIVEGQMDVVSSHQAGVRQVVAVSGTALTLDQLKSLSRLTKNIKICFDADAAGLRATERAIELSQNLGIVLSMIELSSGTDPDDLARQDVEAWRTAISNAKPAVDYLFDQLASVYDIASASGKRQYTDRLAGNLRRLGDPVEQDHYVKLLSQRLGINEEAVRAKIAQNDRAQTDRPARSSRPASRPEPANQQSAVKPELRSARRLLEEAVLAINLVYPEVRLSLDDVTAANFDSLERQAILEAIRRAGEDDAAAIADGLPEQADYVKILTLRGEEEYSSFAPADRSFEAFELARRLQISSTHDIKTKLSRKLREAETKGDTQLARMLLEEYQALLKEEH
jgi:DNA primase